VTNLEGRTEIKNRIKRLNERLARYIPPRETWTPAEEALFKPLVFDSSLTPAGYGEKGRFAFLDVLVGIYPGFIITGDEVLMLEHCPVCDRPGPVLEPEMKRVPSEEVHGCSEELRRILAQTLQGGN
jgi:hypothetical protein